MSPATASLIALLVAITVALTSRINVGVLAMVFAWLVGVYIAGWRAEQVAAGFPSALFLTLAGVTLLFALADANGTLERLAHRAVAVAHGDARILPVVFFFIACALSSVGPGAISTVALLAPLGMAIGMRAGVSPFLTSLVIANGANAGNLSPISAVGVIANTRIADAGLGAHPFKVWFANFIAHLIVALIAYFALSRRDRRPESRDQSSMTAPSALDRSHWITITVVLTWIAAVVVLDLNVGLAAFAAAAVIILARSSDETAALKRMPWGVIIMVCGVTVLIAVLEKTGGMEMFTGLIARLANANTVNGVIAFVTGLISSWSSTAGVVLPAFLPTAPGIVQQLGGGDPLAVALSIDVGASMVDVSPLSTLGALCLATIADPTEARALFKKLLIWGLAMSVVAALLCQLFAGMLARA